MQTSLLNMPVIFPRDTFKNQIGLWVGVIRGTAFSKLLVQVVPVLSADGKFVAGKSFLSKVRISQVTMPAHPCEWSLIGQVLKTIPHQR